VVSGTSSCFLAAQLKPEALGKYRLVKGEEVDPDDVVFVYPSCIKEVYMLRCISLKNAYFVFDTPVLILKEVYGEKLIIFEVIPYKELWERVREYVRRYSRYLEKYRREKRMREQQQRNHMQSNG